MFKKYLIIFIFIICVVFVSKLEAQTLLKSGKVLEDLLISLEVKSSDRPPGTNYILTIDADGNWLLKNIDSISKKESFAKGKAEKSQIIELISEFEKINFFKLKDSDIFGTKDNLCEKHQNTEIISIKFGGKSKQISNYLGCFGDIQNSLASIGKKIREITVLKQKNKNERDSENKINAQRISRI